MKKSELKQLIREVISKSLNENELVTIKRQIKDLNPNFTINLDALKIRSLNLEITHDVDAGEYTIIDDRDGSQHYNKITYPSCSDCKFTTAKEVIAFIRSKS